MLAPTVGHYQFVRDDGQPLDFQPGQFIQVHFSYADGTETKRSYSLATIHDHALGPGEAVDIAVVSCPVALPRRCSRRWSTAAGSTRRARMDGSACTPATTTAATC